jgi:hypothetical protein
MEKYTIFLVSWFGGLFVSDTAGYPNSCCEGKGNFSLAVGPGQYQIEYPEKLVELYVYSQLPYILVAKLINPTTIIDYPHDNMMFYSNGPGPVILTKLS